MWEASPDADREHRALESPPTKKELTFVFLETISTQCQGRLN